MTPSPAETYSSPLAERYASRAMVEIWSPRTRYGQWRRLWLALAEAQHELGLLAEDGIRPRIRPEQLAQLRAHVDAIDFAHAEALERRFNATGHSHRVPAGQSRFENTSSVGAGRGRLRRCPCCESAGW